MFRSVLLLAKVTIGLDGLDTRLQQYYDPQGCWACTPTPAKCVEHSQGPMAMGLQLEVSLS